MSDSPDHVSAAEHIEDLREQIEALTRLREEASEAVSELRSDYTTLLEDKVRRPRKGPSTEDLESIKIKVSDAKLKLVEVEGRLNTAQRELATVIRYSSPGLVPQAYPALAHHTPTPPPSFNVQETATMSDCQVTGDRVQSQATSITVPNRADQSISPSTTASSMSIQSQLGKIAMNEDASPEMGAMLGVIGGPNSMERMHSIASDDYEPRTIPCSNANSQENRAMSSATSPSQDDMPKIATPASPWDPQVQISAPQVAIATLTVNQFGTNAYEGVMDRFSEHGYGDFQARAQAGVLPQVCEKPPVYTDVNEAYGLNAPLLRANFTPGNNHHPTSPLFHPPGAPRLDESTNCEEAPTCSFVNPISIVINANTGLNANTDLNATSLPHFGISATQPAPHGPHTADQPPVESNHPSTMMASGEAPYRSLVASLAPSPAPLLNRPDHTPLTMPQLDHPGPQKAVETLPLSSVVNAESVNSTIGGMDDTESRATKRDRKISDDDLTDPKRPKTDDGDSGARASIGRATPSVRSTDNRPLTKMSEVGLLTKEKIESLISDAVLIWIMGRDGGVHENLRRITRENDDLATWTARISRKVSLHLLSSREGNIQCLYHWKRRGSSESEAGKPWGQYDDEWKVTGKSPGDRVMGSSAVTTACVNCGCTIEDTLMHWILQKTWKVGYISDDGRKMEEGMKGELWKLRTRHFILAQWKKYVGLELDDYFIGEEALLKGLGEGKSIKTILEEHDRQLYWKRLLRLAAECAGQQPSGHLDLRQVFTLLGVAAGKEMAEDIQGAYAREPYHYKHEWDVTAVHVDRAMDANYGDCDEYVLAPVLH